jgi:acyl dehydratase
MALLGERIPAARAEVLGLVNGVFPAEQLLPEVLERARRIAAKSAPAVALTKRMMNRSFESSMEAILDDELATQSFLFLDHGKPGRRAPVPRSAWRGPGRRRTESRSQGRLTVPGRYLEEFVVGEVIRHEITRTVTEPDNILFCAITMNPQPLHIDYDFAARSMHKRPLVNGMYTLSLMMGLTVIETTLGTTEGNLGFESIEFPTPCSTAIRCASRRKCWTSAIEIPPDGRHRPLRASRHQSGRKIAVRALRSGSSEKGHRPCRLTIAFCARGFSFQEIRNASSRAAGIFRRRADRRSGRRGGGEQESDRARHRRGRRRRQGRSAGARHSRQATDTGLTAADINGTFRCRPDAYMLPKAMEPDDIRAVSRQ